MLLTIDAGNTSLKLGLYDGERLSQIWRIATDRRRTGDELGVLVLQLLANGGIEVAAIEGLAIVNVVPALDRSLQALCDRYLGRSGDFVGEAIRPTIPNRYEPPTAVGMDRLVDATAALRRYGAPSVVIDLGTATTVNAISLAGEFVGGAIAPGVGLGLEALHQVTSLPRVELGRPAELIGRSTLESLRSGGYYGFVSQVEGLAARYRRALGCGTQVIATGGLSALLPADEEIVDHIDPYLTLDGLRILWQEQCSNR